MFAITMNRFRSVWQPQYAILIHLPDLDTYMEQIFRPVCLLHLTASMKVLTRAGLTDAITHWDIGFKHYRKKHYEDLLRKYKQVCFKFERDEGGKSFRLIDNQRKGYAALFKKQNTRMTLDDVLDALSEREVFSPIMIMPFLPDEEVSVDCLDTEKGLIALPRIKGNNKYELLRFDEDIISICRDFQNKVGLKCPYNIQFKYLDGIPYFLEVNTRMSGGIQMACYASGVNIPQLALKKISGEELDWSCKYEEKILAQVLQPVTID